MLSPLRKIKLILGSSGPVPSTGDLCVTNERRQGLAHLTETGDGVVWALKEEVEIESEVGVWREVRECQDFSLTPFNFTSSAFEQPGRFGGNHSAYTPLSLTYTLSEA